MSVATIGIDVGKNWFHLIGLDSKGGVIARQRFNRAQLLRFMSKLPRCVVGMEASCGSHHLARELTDMGFDARLMSAKFVRPFLKSNKNDYLDAEAIAEAVQRPVCVSSQSRQSNSSTCRPFTERAVDLSVVALA